METILQWKDLCVAYNADNLAVDQVSISVQQGSILAIVGESGSGKSTLVRSVIGLMSAGGEVTSGRILYRDTDITRLRPSLMRKLRGKEIAMVFQDARACLNPRRTIGSQFVECLRSHALFTAKEARAIAVSALADVRLPDPERMMETYTFELSGGMCQRVALAMAISQYVQPKLLLADEPTSSLDVTIQAQVIRQIRSYRERFGTTIVMVTHNFSIAAYMADHIAVMQGGRLMEWGERDQVILDPQSEYTRQLLDAVPKMETEKEVRSLA